MSNEYFEWGTRNNIHWTEHEKVGPDGGVDLWLDPRCGDRGSEVKIMIMIMMIDGGSHDGDHDGGHDGDHNGDHDGGNSNGSPTI